MKSARPLQRDRATKSAALVKPAVPAKPPTLDPLYVIFEQHLFNFQDSEIDRKTFIGNVVRDYLTHLRKLEIVVPKALESAVIEELFTQVNTMLVKKIYGCLSIGEYQRKVPTTIRKRAKAKYSKLAAKR